MCLSAWFSMTWVELRPKPGPAPKRLRPLKDFDIPLAELARLTAAGAPEYGNFVMHWYDEFDIGLKGSWASPDLDDSNWKTVEIPGGFAELGVPEKPALVWFRKEIVLPDPLPAGERCSCSVPLSAWTRRM